MNDMGLSVLDKYEFEVIKTGRAKGAMLLDTDNGFFLLKSFKGTKRHLEFEENLLDRINESMEMRVNTIVRNMEGNLVSETEDGQKYVLHRWYDAADMDVKDVQTIINAAGMLGKLHTRMNKIAYENIYLNECFNTNEICEQIKSEFVKHNREMKRTRNFIREKQKKNEFELMILGSFEKIYEDGMSVAAMAESSDMSRFINSTINMGRIIHGAFNYHNILCDNKGVIITNFEHSKCGVQVRDLYDFMRKVLEKHCWNVELGDKIICEYMKNRNMADDEVKYLFLKLKYPEKYWKIINHYNNNNKAWIPDKDVNKLKSVIVQYDKRVNFVKSLLNFS